MKKVHVDEHTRSYPKKRPAKKAPAKKKVTAKKAPPAKKATAKKVPAKKKVTAKKAPPAKKVAAKKAVKKAPPAKKVTDAQLLEMGMEGASWERIEKLTGVGMEEARKRMDAAKKAAASRSCAPPWWK